MMRKQFFAPILALALLVGSTAQAGAFFEPIVGYHFGTTEIKSLAGFSTADTSFSGLGFGARAGLMMGKTMFVAADFHYSLLKDENSGKFNQLALGGVLGAKFSKFRIWGGVNFINKFMDDATDGEFKGIGYKAGLGFMLAKSLSLNVEYNINPATELCGGGVCVDIPDSATLNNNSFFVSISAPFGNTGK